MKIRFGMLAISASLAFASLAQLPPGSAPAPKPDPDVKATMPNGVTLHGDVRVGGGPGYRGVTMDIYTPSSAGLHPAVIFVHGGGWMVGSARSIDLAAADGPTILSGLAARGVVVASLNYRLAREATFPAPVEDTRAAVSWLKANAARYKVDPSRIVLWGASAGAQIVTITALDCRENRAGAQAAAGRDTPPSSPCVAGVVDWFGPADLNHINEDGAAMPMGGANSPETTYFGCRPGPCDAATLTRGSPIHYVGPGAPPFLIVQGSADTIVALKQSQRLHEALLAAGDKATLHVVPNANHLFGGASPQDRTAALEDTFRFIQTIGR